MGSSLFFMKKFWWFCVGVFGLVLVFVLLFGNFSRIFITGEAIGVSSPGGCGDSDFVLIWDEVFVENSDGVIFFINDSLVGGVCAGAIGYKIVGNEVWGLSYNRVEDVVGRISGIYFAGYSNMTAPGVSIIESVTSFNESNFNLLIDTMKGGGFLRDRELALDENGADVEFSDRFDVENGTWSVTSDSFVFSMNENIQYFNESSLGGVYINEDGANFLYWYENSSGYVGSGVPVLIRNFTNFTIEQNSSWNVVFGFDEYFSYPVGSVFNFSYTGANNTDGEFIGYDIVGEGARFRPAYGFLGTREFRVRVADVLSNSAESNMFKVIVVSNINEAPVLKKGVGTIALSPGASVTLDLDVYFDDPDGDNLTYRTSTLKNLIVSFSGDRMTVKLGTNFSSYDSFRVYASDGKLEAHSNKIDVIGGAPGTVSASSGTNDSGSVNGSLDNPKNSSAGGNSQRDEWSGIWIWIVLGVFLVLVVIGAVIYFFTYKKGGSVPSTGVCASGQQNSASPINSYLQNLNLPKK